MFGTKAGTVTVLRWLGCVALFACTLVLTGCGGASGSPVGSATSTSVSTIPESATPSVGTDVIAFSADNFSTSQAAGSITITVSRSGTATSAATVKYATSDGTAISGTDYTSTAGTLNWAEQDTTAKSISIPISNGAPDRLPRAACNWLAPVTP